jgi:hypothetical protein
MTSLRMELIKRGFSGDLRSPNGTLVLSVPRETPSELLELFETMVRQREKLFRTPPGSSEGEAKATFDDACIVIEAIRSVFSQARLVAAG